MSENDVQREPILPGAPPPGRSAPGLLAKLAGPNPASDVPEALIEILDSAPMAMVLFDRDLRVIRANERWEFDFRTGPSRLIGRTLFDIDPGSRKWASLYENCMRGERMVSDGMAVALADGHIVQVSSVTVPWKRIDGEVGGVLGMYRLRADEGAGQYDLARTERRLETAIRLSGIHVWEMDHRTKAIWGMGQEDRFTAGSRGFLDLAEDNLIGIHPDDRAGAAAVFERARREGTPLRAEVRLNRPGPEIWASCAMAEYFDEAGALQTTLGVMRDITDRKQAEIALLAAKEEAEAANIAKSAFLATMSHEIRTPLNGVLGVAQAMAAGDLPSAQRDQLNVIQQSGETLLAILNDMLDLSKIEAGKLELEEIGFDLAEIARGAHATFTALANKKGLSFSLDIDAPDGVYRGDPTRLRQILYNLISNALKFTETGEIRVKVEHDGVDLVITVTDTGIGIPEAARAGLFNRFTQADTSTTRRFGGTGLGLAICKQLADLMGGSITLTSREGHGSAFVLRAPIARIGEARGPNPEKRSARRDAAMSELRVLAAEDNGVNQLVLKSLLLQIGVKPLVVDNGELAIKAWEDSDWDLILMDIQMPVMDGATATRAIRAREAESGRARTPIVALTANAMSHHVAEYLACGMDGHVAKPIDARALFEALDAALDAKAEAGDLRAA